jgi:hypothetical protein
MQNVERPQVMTPASTVRDHGQVRMGAMSPSLPAVRVPPASVADSQKVRMGAMCPNLPSAR